MGEQNCIEYHFKYQNFSTNYVILRFKEYAFVEWPFAHTIFHLILHRKIFILDGLDIRSMNKKFLKFPQSTGMCQNQDIFNMIIDFNVFPMKEDLHG